MTLASLRWSAVPLVRNAALVRFIAIIAWTAIIAGTLLRLNQLPSRTLYLDEAFTQIRVAGSTSFDMIQALYDGRPATMAAVRQYAAVDATATPGRLIASLAAEDAQHPPLFYLGELAVVRAFGSALFTWRILPALFGILAILAASVLARDLFGGPNAGLLGAAVFAVSPIERIYSEQAREYSLLVLLVLIATIAVVRAARANSFPAWSVYAVLTAAGLYTNPFMLYVLAGHALFVMGSTRALGRSWTVIAGFAAAGAASLIAYAPWLEQMYLHRNDIADTNVWSATHWPFARLVAKWIFNSGSTFFDLEYLDLHLSLVLGAVALVAGAAMLRGFMNASVEARWSLGTAIAVPALILIAPDVLLGQHRSSVARYGLPVFAMLAILVAGGLNRRPLSAAAILAAGLIACVIGALHPSWWDNDSNADDANIAAIVSAAPHAQVLSSMPPIAFLGFARMLNDDVRVSLSPDLSRATFAAGDPIFVLRPSARELRALERRSGMHFDPVPFSRTRTAHEIGTAIATGSGAAMMSDLYRATPHSQRK